jgi:outer membrane protein OmpA-like peptidoglycan-associated protein
MVSDTLVGPVSFEIIPNQISATPSDDWTKLKEKINANPLVLYFNTNQTSDNLTAEEQSRVAEITNYIENVPASMVNVVGHTDNVGARDLNVILGQTRANFAKKYLIKKGIDASRIETSSQGPDSPIADNATTEGKTKNRRTVITIK